MRNLRQWLSFHILKRDANVNIRWPLDPYRFLCRFWFSGQFVYFVLSLLLLLLLIFGP